MVKIMDWAPSVRAFPTISNFDRAPVLNPHLCADALILRFRFTERYPDALPDFDVCLLSESTEDEDVEDQEDNDSNDDDDGATAALAQRVRDQLKPELDALAQESLGMAMVFTLAGHCQEWLDNEWAQEQARAEAADEERKLAQEEVSHIHL